MEPVSNLSNFKRSSFMISHFKKQKKKVLLFYAGEGPVIRAFQIFALPRPIISNLEGTP